MRLVKGYVFIIPKTEFDSAALMGRGDGNRPYLNFMTNDLNPYADIRDASEGAKHCMEKTNDRLSADICHLEMQICETEIEIESLRNTKKGLVVLGSNGAFTEIFGEHADQRIGYIGSSIVDSDFTPISRATCDDPFFKAYTIAQESRRQGGLKSTLATFELTRLETILAHEKIISEGLDPNAYLDNLRQNSKVLDATELASRP